MRKRRWPYCAGCGCSARVLQKIRRGNPEYNNACPHHTVEIKRCRKCEDEYDEKYRARIREERKQDRQLAGAPEMDRYGKLPVDFNEHLMELQQLYLDATEESALTRSIVK